MVSVMVMSPTENAVMAASGVSSYSVVLLSRQEVKAKVIANSPISRYKEFFLIEMIIDYKLQK